MWILSLLPLLGIIAFIAPVVVIAMLISLFGRVRALEQRIQELSGQPGIQPVPSQSGRREGYASEVASAQLSASIAPPLAVAPVSPAPMQPSEDALTAWLKENWMLKLGALLLLIALGWFVSYAFANNWIGPAGRITLGLVAGAGILSLGFWRMRSYLTQGSVFVVVGATTILLTTYAARLIYDFFTPSSALALMFATSALVALACGLYSRKQLGIASVALAGIAPILAHSPNSDYIGLFAYLFAVIIGALWIVVWKDYREVTLTALIVVALYSVPLFLGFAKTDMSVLLLLAYAFAALFYLSNTAGLLRLKGSEASSDMVSAVINSLLLILWIYFAAPKEWQSLIIDAWAVAFVVAAFLVFRLTGRREPLFLYAGIGVAYVFAATAMQFNGATLTIAYTIESAVVAVAMYFITRDVRSSQKTAFLLVGPTLLAIPSLSSSEWLSGVLNQHFFVLALLSLVYTALGLIFLQPARASGIQEVKNGNAALLIGGTVIAYILLWLSLHAALPQNPDNAVMISLLIYTAIGIGAYLEGVARGSHVVRAYGGSLLIAVVARLLIVDVWQMALTGRIVTFFLIGALLMSTAFLGRTKKPAVTAPVITQ